MTNKFTNDPSEEKPFLNPDGTLLDADNVIASISNKKYITPPSDRFTPEEVQSTAKKYNARHGLTIPETFNSFAYFLQRGGYIAGVTNIVAKVNGKKKETLQLLREVVKEVRPNGTLKQLARPISKIILKFSQQQNYVGHFPYKLRELDPSLTTEDLDLACKYRYILHDSKSR